MKVLKIIVFFIFMIFHNYSYSSNDSLNIFRKYRKIYFYSVGLKAYGPEMTDCMNKQAAKMSFGYKVKGGCVVRPLKFLRVHTHNKRIEAKLKKRFGDNWREQYDRLLVDCKNAS